MGEARRRGSYEQRKAEGETRLTAERHQQALKDAAIESSMTPEDRYKRYKARMLLAQTAASELNTEDGDICDQ